MRIGLSWKVSLAVSVVVIMAMIVVGWVVYQSTGDIVLDQINDQITLISGYHWESISDIFTGAERELQRIAQDQNMRSLADLAKGVDDLDEFLARNVVQATGSRLDREVSQWGLLRVLFITTPTGIVVADSRYKEASIVDIMAGVSEVQGFEHLGISLSPAEYVDTPLGGTGEYDGRNLVIHSVPIYPPSGDQPIGHLVGVLDVGLLFQGLGAELGEYGTTVLLNRQGVILNHSDPDLIGTVTTDSWYLERIDKVDGIAEEMGAEYYLTLLALADGELFLGSSISVEQMTAPVRNIARDLLTMFSIALAAIFVAVALFVAWQLRPLHVFVKAFQRMEAGDLDSRTLFSRRLEKRRDEIGALIRAFISMEGNLKGMVDTLSRSTHETASATEELSASSEEQSASIEEVAAKAGNLSRSAAVIDSSMGRFSATVSHLNQSSKVMHQASTKVNALAQSGLQLMETTESNMTALLDPAADAKGSVVNLNKAVGEIENIVAVISDIAGQTNLLSLNASIEAARAGEHGRGFAVVADEVRKLANGTRESTANIVQIIQQLASQTTETTAQINIGAGKIRDTKETFGEIVELITDLVKSVQEVTEFIGELAASTDEIVIEVKKQAADGEEILAATEEQAAMTAENATLMGRLATMAGELQEIILRFEREQ